MTAHSFIVISIYSALCLLSLSIVASLIGLRRESTLSLYLFLFSSAVFYAIRAYKKLFFPFTDKIESFVALSVLLVICALIYRKHIANKEFITLQILALAAASPIFIFTDAIHYPPMFLYTLWYPLHIPVSFAAYAFWFVAGVSAIYALPAWFRKEDALVGRSLLMTDINRIGFIFFTFAMLFGGIWGYFAWGAYFMWDPKLHWSVILWLFYGNLLHIDKLPKLRNLKIPLYAIGIPLILMTFIGTSFFSQSIHRF